MSELDESRDENAESAMEYLASYDTLVQPDRKRRTPHLGHAALFLTSAFALLSMLETIAVIVAKHIPAYASLPMRQILLIPDVILIPTALSYLIALAIAIVLFPLVWTKSFTEGIAWNATALKDNYGMLVLTGVGLAIANATMESFISIPKDMPVDRFFQSRADLWILAAMGTLLIPAFEEICFRGFLLPALAIAWDWLALPRTDEARDRWQTTDDLSPSALIFAAIASSIAFASLHGPQLKFSPGPLILLLGVSLVLSFVRIRLRSVAASSLVHASYNGLLFFGAFLATHGYTHLDKMPR